MTQVALDCSYEGVSSSSIPAINYSINCNSKLQQRERIFKDIKNRKWSDEASSCRSSWQRESKKWVAQVPKVKEKEQNQNNSKRKLRKYKKDRKKSLREGQKIVILIVFLFFLGPHHSSISFFYLHSLVKPNKKTKTEEHISFLLESEWVTH